MAQITIVHPVRSQVVDGAMAYSVEPINQADEGAVKHFVATYNRALRFIATDDGLTAVIHLGERTQAREYRGADGKVEHIQAGGWLEHTIVIMRGDKPTMTIGAIQRKPYSDSEFHS